MQALIVRPGLRGDAQLAAWPEPATADGEVLARTLLVGICGTDREIVAEGNGVAPATETRLVLGHESLARVIEAPAGCELAEGDLVVPMVRHPDPVPCASCAVGEWDMCRNGLFTEHGIRGRHGFARERYRLPAARLVRVPESLGDSGVLVEPASIVAKAWEHIEAVTRRATLIPRKVLVTGAGPIGLLAALLGRQRGLDVHVLDIVDSGPKPAAVRALGATYHVSDVAAACRDADIVIECTGVGALVLDVVRCNARNAIVCLTGLSSGARTIELAPSQLNRALVLENDVVIGVVNANRRHYEQAVSALQQADGAWLAGLVTRRVPLASWGAAFARGGDDIKVVLDLAS